MSPSRALSDVQLGSFSLHHQAEITFSRTFPLDSLPSGAEASPTLLLWRAGEETLFVGFIFFAWISYSWAALETLRAAF